MIPRTLKKGFGERGEAPGDQEMATAILNRLHHRHVLKIRGES